MDKKEQIFFNSIETIFPQLIEDYEAAGPAHTLHEQAIHAYTIHSFKLLRSVSQSENPLAALEQALIENWKVITGNLLCYTALPTHPITKVWCEAAKVVAASKRHSENGEPANPLLFLIPSLQCVESVHDDYPCLIPVRNQANEWDMDLVHILSTHILNDAGTHLLPLRAMLVLDENAGIPTIYNPYIDDNTEPSSVQMNSTEIYRLAQHCFESQAIYEAKQRLDALTLDNGNLLGQLNLLRQKMRENSVHGVGKELTAGQFFDKNIYDFLAWYDQLDNHSEQPQEVRDFIKKVREFTAPSVKAFDKDLIVKIINAADKLPSEIRDYINPLKPLVKMDQPNSDQLEQARQVIYEVLSKLGFISKPTSTLVTTIPPTLAGLLSKLRKFAFKKNNEEDPNTCLKILGDQLEKLIKKHAPRLSKIGINDDKKQLLVAEVVQSFKDAKALLKKKLINQEAFNGQDKLNLSRKLLSHFSLKLSFTHPQDFEVLERLSEEEIASICSDKEITDSLLNSQNTESLILFALTTSPAKLNALLGALSQSLLDGENKKLCRLLPLLLHLFSALDLEKCKGISEQIKQYFIKLCIQQPSRFSGFMRKLGSDKQVAILDLIREELPKFINTSPSFCKIYSLRILKDTPQKQALFDDMKERLSKLPKNIGEFTQLYNTLSPAHQTLIFPQGLKEKIDTINNLNAFIKIYASLNPEEAANLFSVHKQSFPVWVKTSQNLLDLCKTLTQEQFNELLDIIPIDKLTKNRTPEQIYTALRKTYWHPIPLRPLSLMMSLTDPEKILSFESLLQTIEPIALEQLRLVNKAILPAKLSSVAEITSEHEEKLCEEERQFLRKSREQTDSIFSSIEARLPSFHWDAVTTISNVLRFSNFQQRDKVFHQFIFPQLGLLVDSAANWNILLTNLSPTQRKTVNDFIYSNLVLSELFKRANDFIWGPLKFLNEVQRSYIFKSLTQELNVLIRSFSDLSNFISINMLSNEECRLVFDLFEKEMTRWTDKNAYRITVLFSHLDHEGRKKAFELLKNYIPINIKYLVELISISSYLSKEQIEHITPKLTIINSSKSIALSALSSVKLHERESVIDKIFNFLPQAIDTPEDFISFSRYLTPAQCYELFMVVLPRFSSLEQASLILTELTQKLPKQTARIIFCSMLELFNANQEKFITFCNNQQQSLSNILSSVDDVIFFMKRRMHFDIVLFLEAAKPMLAALNPSAVEYDDLIYRLEPGELKTLSNYLPALKDVIPIDSPGRNSQSFFGSKKRKAEGAQAAPDKRHRQEENSEIGTTYRFPFTEEIPDGVYTFQPPMQALLDDLFPGIPMETDEEPSLNFWRQ
ncbi:hypothetical protein B1207_05945 [Legionella quinlivanii]|uniref:Uncharacterized protein n=1 Tax=Legionella quinlivanii TaxID=45073 RepID=A0A364LK34_9GAMM|nr:hypothetical protein [Legionella quinlivanii]RAP36971.1 hypothetical protein B1207_05945 [Legionella quinlivanii]